MNVTQLLDKIAGRQQERWQQRIAGYRELVAAIAAGREPDESQSERTLANAGKSLADLRQDVERHKRRLALKATVAAMPKLEGERRTVEKQIEQADEALIPDTPGSF